MPHFLYCVDALWPKSRLALSIALIGGWSASTLADMTSAETQAVMGHPPVASALTFRNVTEPGKGLAQGDTVEAVYSYTDPDGDLEDSAKTRWQWLTREGALLDGETSQTHLTTAADNKKFLSFQVIPGSMEPADPGGATAPVVSDYAEALWARPLGGERGSGFRTRPNQCCDD